VDDPFGKEKAGCQSPILTGGSHGDAEGETGVGLPGSGLRVEENIDLKRLFNSDQIVPRGGLGISTANNSHCGG
jgi:hypothetical protein